MAQELAAVEAQGPKAHRHHLRQLRQRPLGPAPRRSEGVRERQQGVPEPRGLFGAGRGVGVGHDGGGAAAQRGYVRHVEGALVPNTRRKACQIEKCVQLNLYRS